MDQGVDLAVLNDRAAVLAPGQRIIQIGDIFAKFTNIHPAVFVNDQGSQTFDGRQRHGAARHGAVTAVLAFKPAVEGSQQITGQGIAGGDESRASGAALSRGFIGPQNEVHWVFFRSNATTAITA